MNCKGLHHAAYRCKSAKETVEFYTKVLGLNFVHAMGEDHVPSTKEYCPHVHIFFQMEDGGLLAFFEAPNAPGDMKDNGMPAWIQHFAIRVESVEKLLQAKTELEAKGISVLGPTEHDGFISSIYFFDPSGHRLELTADHDDVTAEDLEFYAQEAPKVLALWEETHDWSKRETLFGAKHGYAREKRVNA